jgi:hypothetical protein
VEYPGDPRPRSHLESVAAGRDQEVVGNPRQYIASSWGQEGRDSDVRRLARAGLAGRRRVSLARRRAGQGGVGARLDVGEGRVWFPSGNLSEKVVDARIIGDH